MSIDDAERHDLFVKLEHVLGRTEASTLMAYLPPGGPADLVTRPYLDARLDALEQRLLATFRAEMAAQVQTMTRTVVLTSLGSSITTATFVLAAIRLGAA